jgi:hypothetical protein
MRGGKMTAPAENNRATAGQGSPAETSGGTSSLSPKRMVDRSRRLSSHALVDIKTNRWNPFSRHSAVLLDLSSVGFKVEFINTINLAKGTTLFFRLPLAPFKIDTPTNLRLTGTVVWFDARTMRAGGTFSPPKPQMEQALQKVIERLQASSHPDSLHP